MDSIPEGSKKINRIHRIDRFSLLLVIVSAVVFVSAAMGGFVLVEAEKSLEKPFLAASAIYSSEISVLQTTTPVVASKNGSKYYLATCGSAKRIKLENLVTFQSREEAELAGYEPAKNCTELDELDF